MKKKAIIIVLTVFLIILAVFVAGFFAFRYYVTPRGSFVMDEKLDTVNGDSNPTNGFANIGFKNGKLYYEFSPSDIPGLEFRKAGVYEVDEKGARLWNEDAYDIWDVFPERQSSDDSDEDDDFEIIGKIKDVYDHNTDTDDETYDEMSWEKLYTITDKCIVYLSNDFYIKKLDRKTLKCLHKVKLKNNVIDFKNFLNYQFMIKGEKLLLIGQVSKSNNPDLSSDCAVVYNVTKNFKKLFSKDMANDFDTFSFNLYKDTLFAGHNNGIYAIDTNSGKTQKLTNRMAEEMYVFGDKWVYFVSSARNLYRVSQDGEKEETVFAMGW